MSASKAGDASLYVPYTVTAVAVPGQWAGNRPGPAPQRAGLGPVVPPGAAAGISPETLWVR